MVSLTLTPFVQVIPEPRCINNVKAGLEKGRYKETSDVYTDLSLVFWNALFYNEPGSQIALDAETLKVRGAICFCDLRKKHCVFILYFKKKALETEWKKKGSLSSPRVSPPPSSAQKVHGVVDQQPQHSVKTESAIQQLPLQTSAQSHPATTTTTTMTTPTPILSPSKMPRSTSGPSTNTTTYAKPVPIRPKSAQRQTSPDAEIDIVAEDDVAGEEAVTDRDPESEEIVRQLEKGLPRWSGFGDQGWMKEGTSVCVEILLTQAI